MNLSHTFCGDGQLRVAWSEVEKLLLCEAHSLPGVNNMPIDSDYLSWESFDGKICLYIASHVVQLFPGVVRVYGDAYVASFRIPPTKLINGSTCSADAITTVQAVLYRNYEVVDPIGLSGSVLIAKKEKFYVIHDKDSVAKFPEVTPSHPSGSSIEL